MQRATLLSMGRSSACCITEEDFEDNHPTEKKTYNEARHAALVVRPGNAERENSKVAPNGQCGRGALARTHAQQQRGEFIDPGHNKVCVC